MTRTLKLRSAALAATLALTVASGAVARDPGPRIEPGPVLRLDVHSLDFLAVVGKNLQAFSELMTRGNTVVGASVQHRTPELTLYGVSVAHCARRGAGWACLGGATLTINRFVGSEEDRYETRLELLRD